MQSDDSKRVLLLSERAYRDAEDPGYALRIRGLHRWLSSDATVSLTEDFIFESVRNRSIQERLWGTFAHYRKHRRLFEEYDLVIVAGLGSPQMTCYAAALGAHVPTVLDVCDSVVRTISSQWSQRLFKGPLLYAVLNYVLLRYLAATIGILYITDEDAGADSRLNIGRTVRVLCPPAVNALQHLGNFIGPAERIVIPADLDSYHNQEVYAWLCDLIDAGEFEPGVPIEVYGPMQELGRCARGIAFKGWAPALASVYDGQSIVLAPNLAGVGLQNKVWESIWAGRPVIVGEAAGGVFKESPWVHTFQDQATLRAALTEVLQLQYGPGVPRGWPLPPNPKVGDFVHS